MNDYIKREDAVLDIEQIVDTMSVCLNRDEYNGMRRMKQLCIAAVSQTQAADVRENLRGHWDNVTISRIGNSSADCSICGATVYDSFTKHMPPSFCPNCGALMTKAGCDEARV